MKMTPSIIVLTLILGFHGNSFGQSCDDRLKSKKTFLNSQASGLKDATTEHSNAISGNRIFDTAVAQCSHIVNSYTERDRPLPVLRGLGIYSFGHLTSRSETIDDFWAHHQSALGFMENHEYSSLSRGSVRLRDSDDRIQMLFSRAEQNQAASVQTIANRYESQGIQLNFETSQEAASNLGPLQSILDVEDHRGLFFGSVATQNVFDDGVKLRVKHNICSDQHVVNYEFGQSSSDGKLTVSLDNMARLMLPEVCDTPQVSHLRNRISNRNDSANILEEIQMLNDHAQISILDSLQGLSTANPDET